MKREKEEDRRLPGCTLETKKYDAQGHEPEKQAVSTGHHSP